MFFDFLNYVFSCSEYIRSKKIHSQVKHTKIPSRYFMLSKKVPYLTTVVLGKVYVFKLEMLANSGHPTLHRTLREALGDLCHHLVKSHRKQLLFQLFFSNFQWGFAGLIRSSQVMFIQQIFVKSTVSCISETTPVIMRSLVPHFK